MDVASTNTVVAEGLTALNDESLLFTSVDVEIVALTVQGRAMGTVGNVGVSDGGFFGFVVFVSVEHFLHFLRGLFVNCLF